MAPESSPMLASSSPVSSSAATGPQRRDAAKAAAIRTAARRRRRSTGRWSAGMGASEAVPNAGRVNQARDRRVPEEIEGDGDWRADHAAVEIAAGIEPEIDGFPRRLGLVPLCRGSRLCDGQRRVDQPHRGEVALDDDAVVISDADMRALPEAEEEGAIDVGNDER